LSTSIAVPCNLGEKAHMQYGDITTKKTGSLLTSRSLNVLKKSEKGMLTEYQRFFSFWKKSSATGRCFTDWKIL